MKNNLKTIIIKAKESDNKNEDMSLILALFEKLINKYARLLDNEDTRQDLNLFLINLILNMNIDSESKYNEKQLLSYISKSIKNEYIRLSKIKSKISSNENDFDQYINFFNYTISSELEILDLIKDLNYNEKNIIKELYINDNTVNEIATILGISRQAVNQVKNRALNKLRKAI